MSNQPQFLRALMLTLATGVAGLSSAQTPAPHTPLTPAAPIIQPAAPVKDCAVIDPELQLSYQGGCLNGLAHGRGVARGTYGAYYNGEFKAGAKHGQGRKVYGTGDVYEGGWANDSREGYGTYVYGELSPWRGDRSEGEWVRDARHGKGVYIFGPDNVRMETMFFAGAPLAEAPPSIAQRKRAAAVLIPVIGRAGTPVCSVTTQGASPRNIARGVVSQAIEDRIQVRIATQRVFDLSMSKANPRWDSITDWGPC